MKRETLATFVFRLLFILFGLVSVASAQIVPATSAPAAEQTSVINLVSISAVSGDTPKVVFTFDGDLTPYVASTYKIIAVSKGLPNTASALAIPNANPKTISVPLDFTALASADSVQISVSLADNAHQVLTTPFYLLDLSFLKAVKGYQDQIVGLAADNRNLASQNASCKTDRDNLIKKSTAQQFDYKEPDLIAPTMVILRFETDKYTTIQVTDTDTTKVFKSVGLIHHVKITGLAPGVEHHFRATPVDISAPPATGKGNKPGMADQPNPLVKNIVISTPEVVPFVPLLTLTSSSPTSITAKVDLDPTGAHPKFKGYITLHYRQVIDEKSGIYAQSIDIGDGALDSNGVPQGTAYTGSHEFVISVAPGKRYNVTYTAYDEFGDVVNSPAPGNSIATGPLPDPLGFKTPVAVTMNSDTGLTVSWTANRPVTKAEMSVTLADGTVIIPAIKKDASSADVTVNTDLKGLATLIEQATPGPKGPIITVSMSDGTSGPGGSASVSLSVTFVLPKSSGNQPTQKAGTQIATVAKNGSGKIDWKTLLASGLGIIAKAL